MGGRRQGLGRVEGTEDLRYKDPCAHRGGIITSFGGGHKPGDVIDGRFSLTERLGAGSYGTVWRARDTASGQDVAVKILRPETEKLGWVVDRFAREVETLSVLRHENIALSIAGAMDEGGAYLAMELIEGEMLSTFLTNRSEAERPLTDEEVLQTFTSIVRGVGYAHAHGVVHRDLKPKNIMVGKEGQLKILDFGVAKLTAKSGPHDATTVGRVLGSILYMSPEQFRSKTIDHRADIFALGTILFELLTLRKTWALNEDSEPMRLTKKSIGRSSINNFTTVMERIVSGPRPRVTDFRAGATRDLDTVCQRAMAAEPTVRFAKADDMLNALEQTLFPTTAKKPNGPSKTLIAVSAVAGLLGAALVAPTDAPNDPKLAEIRTRNTQTYQAQKLAQRAHEPEPEPDLTPKRARAIQATRMITLPSPEAPNAELHDLVEKLRKNPNQPKLVKALGQGIIRKAKAANKPQIEGRAVSSMMVRDIDGLARCLSDLER